MARLDAESAVARQPRQHQRMAPDDVVAYLRSLPSLWNDAGPEGRQALASALFTKLEVEGYQTMRYELTPEAVDLGLGAALPAQLETGGHTGGFGRGERGSASRTQQSVRLLIINATFLQPNTVRRSATTASSRCRFRWSQPAVASYSSLRPRSERQGS